ncbi:MAG: hypothetical protein IPP65_03390 [Chlorobi bacterium]|jgi:hypothetical protein|nr:hypothetical protein [Chlorobiota bacterium]
MLCLFTISLSLVSVKNAFAQIQYCGPDTTGCTPWVQSSLNIVPPCCPSCTVKVFYAYRWCGANNCEVSPTSWSLTPSAACLSFLQLFEPNYPSHLPFNSVAYTDWMNYSFGQISTDLFTKRYNALKIINQESSLECPNIATHFRYYETSCTACCVYDDYRNYPYAIDRFVVKVNCNNNSCCFISRDYCWDTSATPPGPKYTQTVSSNPPEPVCPNELPTCSYIFGGGVVPNYLTYLYTTDCISPCANPPTSIILKDTLIPRISKTY